MAVPYHHFLVLEFVITQSETGMRTILQQPFVGAYSCHGLESTQKSHNNQNNGHHFDDTYENRPIVEDKSRREVAKVVSTIPPD